MDFERLPGRLAPRAPSPPTLPCTGSATQAPLLANHCVPHATAKDGTTSENSAAAEWGSLQRRAEVLAVREDALAEAQQRFKESMAAWETQRRLWEADYAERLARLEAREARLGSGDGILACLLHRCHRSLRFYDPATTCAALYALGQLRMSGLHAPALLQPLVPSLPTYTPVQLTALLESLSLLRASHLAVTAHLLHLFLVALRSQASITATTGTPANRGSWLSEVASLAAMIRVLQQHHTPRTVRAFLAAVDRALATRDCEGRDGASCGVSTGSRSGRLVPTAAASASSLERQAAMQLLYILEVYINAGIFVAEPHTPRWLMRVLSQAPPNSFAVGSLLHLHNRLLAAESVTPPIPPRWEEWDGALRSLLVAQSAVVVETLTRAARVGRVGEGERWQASGEGQTDASRSCLADLERAACDVVAALSEAERHAALRCAVIYELHKSAEDATPDWEDGDSVRGVLACCHPSQTDAPAEALSLSFYRLTPQFCWGLCGQLSWWWWLQVLDAAPSAASRAATLQSIGLLQLLHGRYVRCRGGGSADAEDVRTAPRDASGDGAHSTATACLLDSVRRLCDSLAVCCTFAHQVASRQVAHAEVWELLSLLLAAESTPRCGEGCSFLRWLEAQLPEVESGLWTRFRRTRAGAVSSLVALWRVQWTASVCFMSEAALCVHWVIANALDALCCNVQQQQQRSEHDSPLSLPESDVNASFASAWAALTATTVMTLRSTVGATRSTSALEGDASPAVLLRRTCELEVYLLHVFTDCLSRYHSRCPPSAASSLLDSVVTSELPELVCDVVEDVTSGGDTSWLASRRPPPSPGCRSATTRSSSREETEEEEEQLQCSMEYRRGVRVWWVSSSSSSSCASADDSPSRKAVLRPLLRIGLSTGRRAPFARTVLPRFLIVYLQCSPRRRAVAPEEWPGVSDLAGTASAMAVTEGRRDSPVRQRSVLAALLWQVVVDGVPCRTEQSAFQRPLTPLVAPVVTREGTAHASTWHTFTPVMGVTDTMMSSVESFCVREDGEGGRCGGSANSTLRDIVRGRSTGWQRRRSSSRSSSVVPAVLDGEEYRTWYRDAHPISLTAHTMSCRCLLVSGGSDRGQGRSQRECAASLSSTPVLPLVEVLERVKMVSSAAALLRFGEESPPRTWPVSVGTFNFPGLNAAHRRGTAPTKARLFRQLRRFFWQGCHQFYCQLSLCGDMTKAQSPRRDVTAAAEAAVLQCMLQWSDLPQPAERRCVGEEKQEALDDPPRTLVDEQDSATRPIDDTDAFSLLLPHLWRSLHTAAATVPAHPAVLFTSDVVTSVWRLHVFVEAWGHHLPPRAADGPLQLRLLACVSAALGGDEHAESRRLVLPSLRALGNKVRLRHAKTAAPPTSLPFQHLTDALEGMARDTLRRRETSGDSTVREGVDHGSEGWHAPRGADGLAELSPIELYLELLLPFHPFLRCPHSCMQGVDNTRETQLAALTWAHIVVIGSICEHHPRIHVGHTRAAQLGWVDAGGRAVAPPPTERLRAALQTLAELERQLREGSAHPAAAGGSESTATRGRLLSLCLVRELKTALTEMTATLIESGPPSRRTR